MGLRDVLVGLLAPLARVNRGEGAVVVSTPLGVAVVADPSKCDQSDSDIGRAYIINGWAFPVDSFRRVGDLDVRVLRAYWSADRAAA